MSAPPERDLLEVIATELGVRPSFIEKDGHAMRLVAFLIGIEHDTLRPVFSGGTSLSKGYQLISRFSEDLDFKLILPEGGVSRPDRRTYRQQVIEAMRASSEWTVDDANVQARNNSRFLEDTGTQYLIASRRYGSAFVHRPGA